jgi:DNA-binding CsgD family transcriptional regulator
VSLGRYADALRLLDPLIAGFDPAHDTEIWAGGYLPDAIEALTSVGRIDEAERLVTALEGNGARLDRPWMRAVGARGRAQVQAARGDLEGAEQTAARAMTEHRRLPMPFEEGRTRLLLGTIQRRLRRVGAESTLREALATFEDIGAPLWAEKARESMASLRVARVPDTQLTPSEWRIAELAASGVSNRDIAQRLFISPKTVEAHLSRIYRKLGVRSRAGLGSHVGQRSS